MRRLFEFMWISSVCVDVQVKRFEDVKVKALLARDRQGMLYRRREKSKHTDMLIGAGRLSNTDTHREACLHTCTQRYKHTHTQTYTNTHSLHTHTHTQKLLHTETFTPQAFTHGCSFLHGSCCTQKPLHADTQVFKHTTLYTQALAHTYSFTMFYTNAFAHKHLYTQALLHTDALGHRREVHRKAR